MSEVAYIPPSAPFTAEQRAWLNGFLAGLLCHGAGPAATPEATATRPLLILYGSQTGSAERLAKQYAREALPRGFAARVLEANAYATVDLKAESQLLLITSTWGEGDPPDNAAAFWNYLHSAAAPDLNHLSFAVLALGDRNYADFCGAGRKFDERLEKLGARRIHPRADCDVDYETAAQQWITGVWQTLASIKGEAAVAPIAPAPGTETPAVVSTKPSRANPFAARLLKNRVLTGAGSSKETRHFEISLAGSGLAYVAGDALGVFPTNNAALVQSIVERLGCDGEEEVTGATGATTSLRRALLHEYDIARLSRGLVEFVGASEGSAALKALLTGADNAALDHFMAGRDLLDLLDHVPPAAVRAAELVKRLRKLSPRLYSISSSPKAHPDEVHLTVGIVRYTAHKRAREGVCSSFLADRVSEKTPVPVFVQPSAHFHLPTDPTTSIIMVGPGTGIAPFRAFLEERAAVGATGKNWLFFGDQHAATDFLYRDELEGFLTRGVLTRLDTAFSRDQADKIYVQHRMLAHATELWAWLQEGAHFYVCGDAKRMAKDVDAALQEVAVTGGGRTIEQATEFVVKLKSEKRYRRDVY